MDCSYSSNLDVDFLTRLPKLPFSWARVTVVELVLWATVVVVVDKCACAVVSDV